MLSTGSWMVMHVWLRMSIVRRTVSPVNSTMRFPGPNFRLASLGTLLSPDISSQKTRRLPSAVKMSAPCNFLGALGFLARPAEIICALRCFVYAAMINITSMTMAM